MTRATIELCALCNLPLEGSVGMRHQKINPMNGLKIEIGYSLGGWGSRRNHVDFSGEVCIPCYNRVMPAVVALQQALADCEGDNSYDPTKELGRG